MSICPRSTPWLAQVGSAWWELCQDSPIDRMARGQKLADLGFAPERDLEDGLAETVDWCRSNPDRWSPVGNAEAVPA